MRLNLIKICISKLFLMFFVRIVISVFVHVYNVVYYMHMREVKSMADERKAASKHTIFMDEREKISVTGVLDVISFDEETIITETERGILILKGINLHVNKLNLDNGELVVDGEIFNITYEDNVGFSKGKSSLFGKIFR